jgi:hypothetical protein
VLQPGRPGCTSLAPAASGQTVFTCQTDFLEADEGPQQFVAFVKAKLFGIPVPLLLEIAANAVATVDVVVEDQLTIDTSTLPNGTVGTNYLQTLQASGGSGTLQWSVTSGQLPPGLSLASSGAITGTPTTAGAFTFTVTVASGTQTTQRSLSVTIGTVTPALIEGVYDGTANLTGLDIPTGAFPRTERWFVTESSPGTGVYLLQRSTRLAPALLVISAGTFQPTSAAGNATATGSLVNGRLRFEIEVQAGSCQVLFTGAITSPCTYTFDGIRGPAITTTSLPDGVVGSSYSAILEATGGVGNFQWSLSAGQLPPGLSLAAGGAITGVPTTAGSFSFTVKVVSGLGEAERARRDSQAAQTLGRTRERLGRGLEKQRSEQPDHGTELAREARVGRGIARRMGADRGEPLARFAGQFQPRPFDRRHEIVERPRHDAQTVPGERQLANNARLEQADGIARGRIAKARMKFLGNGRAADLLLALDDANRQTGTGRIARADEAVVTAADDDQVELHPVYNCSPSTGPVDS